MKLSISNIAWQKQDDEEIYSWMEQNNFSGLEIAPTRVFSEDPYEKLQEAKAFKTRIFQQYGLQIASMQSIWYGRKENIFETEEDRKALIEYTKKAFEFANALECKNVVFGCPRNRNNARNENMEIAVDFFGKLAELAQENNTVLAMEANPAIYHTNFLNRTNEVVEFIQSVNSQGLKLNYDYGAVIENGEQTADFANWRKYVNHVHISRPHLDVVLADCYEEIKGMLVETEYDKFVSIEMRDTGVLQVVKNAIEDMQKCLGAKRCDLTR